MIKKIILITLILVIIFLGLTTTKYFLDKKEYITLPLNYSESSQSLMNPERGWYSINSFMVNDTGDGESSVSSNFSKQYKEGDRLALLLFNISNYRNQEISSKGLDYITNVLGTLRKSGMKGIIRFVYDWDGKGIEKEPANIDIVIRHIEQLTPLIQSNSDVIYLLQGILVGSYGEMHGSKFLDKKDVDILLNKLLSAADNRTFLSVRTPAYWRQFFKTKTPPTSFANIPQTRIGLYNDGLLSSNIDLGTYSDGTEANNDFSSKWERSKELDFQSELCTYVPNGGEFALENEYNNFSRVISEFPKLHISYINKGYNEKVLQKLKESIYISKKLNDPYSGLDGYKYLQDHLGYRFVLREVSVPKKIYRGKSLGIRVKIENTGFANLYYEKTFTVLLKEAASGKITSIPVNGDVRLWKSGTITQMDIKIPGGSVNAGVYQIFLKISDKTQGIQMANSDIYDERLEANSIGELQVYDLSLKNIWGDFLYRGKE